MTNVSRRSFLRTATVASGAVAVAGLPGGVARATATADTGESPVFLGVVAGTPTVRSIPCRPFSAPAGSPPTVQVMLTSATTMWNRGVVGASGFASGDEVLVSGAYKSDGSLIATVVQVPMPGLQTTVESTDGSTVTTDKGGIRTDAKTRRTGAQITAGRPAFALVQRNRDTGKLLAYQVDGE